MTNRNPDHVRNNDGSLTRKEFVASYAQRGNILRRQDADEQRRRLNCLLLYGPHVNREVGNTGVVAFVCNLINTRTNVEVVDILTFSATNNTCFRFV